MPNVRGHARRGTRGVRPHYRMAFLPREENAPLLAYQPATQELVTMTPAEFLALAPPRHIYEKSSLSKMRQRMEQGLPLDAPFFDVDVQTGEVLGHEGRHRARVAQELGVEQIPVLLYHRVKNDRGNYEPAAIRFDPYHHHPMVKQTPFVKGYTSLRPQHRNDG